MKIVIKDVEYTVEEAKELYMELSKIFGEEKEYKYIPYIVPCQPNAPYQPYVYPVITCDTTQ